MADLGGGWEAIWDSSLDGLVQIQTTDVTDDAIFIEKSAEFTQGPENGVFPAIPIVFRQISPDAVANIVIDDEILVNNTAHDWTDFHMDLVDHGDATFDPATAAGWSIAPFTQWSVTPNGQRLDLADGVVADGDVWFPGMASGQLWINVNLTPGLSKIFTLKEQPTPEPATMSLLALGGAVLLFRRRRK
jgi:hypothetical protein